MCDLGSVWLMLLEREYELGLMSDLLAGVGLSGGKVVLIRGEAGIGRSVLVRELVYADDQATPRAETATPLTTATG